MNKLTQGMIVCVSAFSTIMVTGCGAGGYNNEATIFDINGKKVPVGIYSLYTRQQQATTEAMLKSFMGNGPIWDKKDENNEGKTYGQEAKEQSLKDLEIMYILSDKAKDYKVSLTKDNKTEINKAVEGLFKDNSKDVIEKLGCTKEQAEKLLELETIKVKIYKPIIEEANIKIDEKDALQGKFTYILLPKNQNVQLAQEGKEVKKAMDILSQLKANPNEEMSNLAKKAGDKIQALDGTFFVNKPKDEKIDTAYFPKEVTSALRTMKVGEVYKDIIKTEKGIYIIKLVNDNDKEATLSKLKSMESEEAQKYYEKKTNEWLEKAKITVDKKVSDKIKITDSDSYVSKSLPQMNGNGK